MAASAQDDDFDEYDKPGTERSRRRRGEDDDLESDLEGDLLEEDWLTSKKNASEASDEELNDDLLQSDDEDHIVSGQSLSLNATLGASFDQQGDLGEEDYPDEVHLELEGQEEAEGEYPQEGEEYGGQEGQEDYGGQADDAELPEDQMEYSGEQEEGEELYQDEVLDIQINEPIDDEFQVDDYSASFGDEPPEMPAPGERQQEQQEEERPEEEDEEAADGSQFPDTEEVENEQEAEKDVKEESDEEEEDDEESGRLRFKTERKDVTVTRLADAASKRRNIPETLELSEEAKADLMEFEEQERQRRQGRFGGRGRGGRGGPGGRGRGMFSNLIMGDFRGDGRGRMNDQRIPIMPLHMGMQSPSRMPSLHQAHHLHHQQQHHHNAGPRGPPFQEHGGPLAQQPLQPLIPPHMAHRSSSGHAAPARPQMEPPPRMMSSPPPNHAHQHQNQQQAQPQQPKNIHINPHFRGPASSPAQVPLMPPAQSQPRPAVGPQRFPGPGDFQQHMPGSFGQPQRPPHHMEPWRNQPPPPLQDREPFFIGEPRFPGQHMFDHQNPSASMTSGGGHHQQAPGQGHPPFGQPGPGFGQGGQGSGSLGLFQREPPRPNLPPQGMGGLAPHGGGHPNARSFMEGPGLRQPFPLQQGNPFSSQQIPFGMQVRMRGLMHGPPHPQLQHHDSPLGHPPMHPQHPQHPQHQQHQQQQHHRQDLSQPPPHPHLHPGPPHALQHPLHPSEQQQQQRPMMHHTQGPFQELHGGSPRQMPPRPQNPQQQRSAPIRPRMSNPKPMQLLPQRNSNLRELPVATDNPGMNAGRPASTPTSNVRPVARAAPGGRPGQNLRPVPGGGRGRGRPAGDGSFPPGNADRTVVRKEIPSAAVNATPVDPEEDEETRQYRLKIEEQKRLREEILRRKEMRRQMQAGVRKKELLDRITGQGANQGPGQGPTANQNPAGAAPPPQQQQHPHQQQQQQQQQQPPLQQQQQRQQALFPPKPQQLLNNPHPGASFPPNGTPHTPPARQNVKTRLQMSKAGPQHQGPGAVSIQQAQWLQQQQQRRNLPQQSPLRPGPPFQNPQAPQGTMPMQGGPGVGQGQGQGQGQGLGLGNKAGVKRTVMQRSNSGGRDGLQIPQKVRVVKLLGGGGDGPDVGPGQQPPPPQQPSSRLGPPPLRQGPLRKVTLAGPPGQPLQSLAMGGPQPNRVVVPGRGRGRGVAGAGAAPTGWGRPPVTAVAAATRGNQRSAEGQSSTVSIEGLSSSTTDTQLRNLLNSIGPVQMFKMLPQQRKAIATFVSPQHAQNFQVSFNRHMIDLSHIDVSLIDG